MLKPRKRISKKELKQDQLVTFYFKARDWIEQNSKYMLMAAAGIVLIIAAFYLFSLSQKKSEQTASTVLIQAMRTYEVGNFEESIISLGQVVQNYGGTKSGKLARFYLANAFFQLNDFANAEQYFRKFVSDFKGDEQIRAAAMGGIAASLEQKKEYEKAAQQYLKIIDQYPESMRAPYYLIRAARCLELSSKADRAQALYDKIIQDYSDSAEKDEAIILKAMSRSS